MMHYIQELEHYTPEDIAQQCIEVGMFEEAFEIYKKHGEHTSAVGVLIEHIGRFLFTKYIRDKH